MLLNALLDSSSAQKSRTLHSIEQKGKLGLAETYVWSLVSQGEQNLKETLFKLEVGARRL